MSTGPILIQPDGGHELHEFGDKMTVFLNGEQTAGQMAVMAAETPPGMGPPPHIHHNEDELFLVIDGSISYFRGDDWVPVRPGGVVYVPRHSLHSYRNDGDTPSHHWVITTPSGFEVFFARCAEEFAKPGEPAIDRIVEIALEHGTELLLG